MDIGSGWGAGEPPGGESGKLTWGQAAAQGGPTFQRPEPDAGPILLV